MDIKCVHIMSVKYFKIHFKKLKFTAKYLPYTSMQC